MVYGSVISVASAKGTSDPNSTRKSCFDVGANTKPHKKCEDKKSSPSQHGAWGPIFKNKDNFVNMHFC
ncbi:hypothetical protein LSTR_LSTR001277 [Laodelphax striatellus]|uniref:Uncharacterized protein n=1 Tax=Laodelphax striatellus TaxID=195883 RepID=A0A482XBM6_LAOST|nr:hypothetical protein LSTR_LSTR001277 [Laodelphax striatellus]